MEIKEKILFVEDDMVDRMAIGRFMKSSDINYDYSFAGSVKEAKEKMSLQNFDAVVIDYLLGDGTAFDLFSNISEVPFIIVTGTGDEGIAVKAMKAGASDYLIKNPDGSHLQTLSITIENAINRKKANEELQLYRQHLEELVQTRTAELVKENEERKRTEIILKNQNEEIAALNKKYISLYEALKVVNDELTTAKEKAEESDRLKTAFLANMSHEIRTPMNGIIGFASLLDDEETTIEQRRRYINIINANAEQLLTIISDIIDISKIEANQINITIKECNINYILDEVIAQFEAVKEQKQKDEIQLIANKYFDDKNANIKTDEVRLRQILTNLLSNAIKFTDKGFIEMGYKFDDAHFITFYTKDTGIGINPENQKVIFENFRQVEDDYTRKYGGTGLGLAISKGLVNILGGDIWVESNKDNGSTFYFTLPYLIQHSEAILLTENLLPDWENINVLLVEDTDSIIAFVNEIFRSTKCNLIKAHSGNEAIDICKSNQALDIVLLDIQLPDLSGIEVAIEMKKYRPDLPIIAQTAHAMESDKLKALQAGCDSYVTKPYTRKILFDAMRQFLQS